MSTNAKAESDSQSWLPSLATIVGTLGGITASGVAAVFAAVSWPVVVLVGIVSFTVCFVSTLATQAFVDYVFAETTQEKLKVFDKLVSEKHCPDGYTHTATWLENKMSIMCEPPKVSVQGCLKMLTDFCHVNNIGSLSMPCGEIECHVSAHLHRDYWEDPYA